MPYFIQKKKIYRLQLEKYQHFRCFYMQKYIKLINIERFPSLLSLPHFFPVYVPQKYLKSITFLIVCRRFFFIFFCHFITTTKGRPAGPMDKRSTRSHCTAAEAVAQLQLTIVYAIDGLPRPRPTYWREPSMGRTAGRDR